MTDPLIGNIQIKVTDSELKKLIAKAKDNDRSLSSWGRLTLLKELKK